MRLPYERAAPDKRRRPPAGLPDPSRTSVARKAKLDRAGALSKNPGGGPRPWGVTAGSGLAERPASDRLGEILPRVRDFARAELLPHQAHFDSLPEPPVPQCEAFHQLGMSGWWLPERYGGMGLGLEESVDIVSELAYGDARCPRPVPWL